MSKTRIFVVLTSIIAALYIAFTMPIVKGLDLQGGMQLILEAQDTETVKADQEAVLGVIEVIRNRIDSLGLTEPVIAMKGHNQITVELPGIKNPQRAISLIGETALLEFIEAEWAPGNIDALTPENLEILAGKDAKLSQLIEKDSTGAIVKQTPIILKKTVLTGKDLQTALPGTSQYGDPVVNIEFNAEGAKKFFDTTARSVGKPIAILLDGTIISAPNVNEPISGGRAQISGSFSVTEMKDLVIKLKAGALPVPVEIISNKIVGPTLGQDSVEKSKIACLIGLVFVCLYMIAFYRIPGVIASFTLITYLLLVFALLKLFQATLTLPGIAGLILTMGMAVDANVIIFERVKEERSKHDSLKAAIHAGFSNAFRAILDANITTLIAAIVLFYLGTGTIKGFAITLSIGILVSMYTAIVITKLLLLLIASKTNSERILSAK